MMSSVFGIGTFIIVAIGFATVFIVGFRLKNFIAIEKLHSVKDPKLLFPNSFPPKFILNERGLYWYKFQRVGHVLIVLGMILWFLFGFLDFQKERELERNEQKKERAHQ